MGKAKKSKKSSDKFSGDLLHNDDKGFIEKRKLTDHLTKRRARYWCYRYAKFEESGVQLDEAPPGFKEFIESLHGFSDWSKFADTWDIDMVAPNTFIIIDRTLSVWKEWEHIMDRVAIPINSTKGEIDARVASLTKEYARKYGN